MLQDILKTSTFANKLVHLQMSWPVSTFTNELARLQMT